MKKFFRNLFAVIALLCFVGVFAVVGGIEHNQLDLFPNVFYAFALLAGMIGSMFASMMIESGM